MDVHALLIGIAGYEPNDVCSSLDGPVADVEALAEYLARQGVARERIRKLTSPPPGGKLPPPEDRPTYENMVEAFQRITRGAEPGDQVLIHYSGHGGQTRTLIPETKGKEGLDEGLVPPDIGDPAARYLRDVELSFLLQAMVEKGLAVTWIVDACHSAGLTRGKARMVPRGCRRVDETARPLDSLVATPKELELAWRRLHSRAYVTTRGASRDPRQASGWTAPVAGAVVLAACRSFEAAYEFPFDGEVRGLLTYCLLEILAEGGDLSFRQLHNRLIGRIRAYPVWQTPVLEGDPSRRVLGGGLRSLLQGITVLQVDDERRRVLVGTGRALGVREGALLRILREAPGGPAEGPLLEIEECGAVESWGTLQEPRSERAAVSLDDRAVLVDPGDHLRQRVAVVRQLSGEAGPPPASWRRTLRLGNRPSSGRAAGADRFLDPMEQALAERASRFLEPAEAGDPDLQVAVDPRGQVEIWYADGRAVADLPPLRAGTDGAVERVLDWLVHLGKFRNVHRLENDDQRSPLHRKLAVEIGPLPDDYVPGDKLELRPFDVPGPLPGLKTGRWICLGVTNHSLQQLHVYVLDLQPGWSIEQIHPKRELETLEGGQQLLLPFKIYLPRAYESQRETFKVFATDQPTDFRWLELPPLDRPARVTRSRPEAPNGSLERLFAEIAADGPRTRSPRTQRASWHWTSAQIEFEVVGPQAL